MNKAVRNSLAEEFRSRIVRDAAYRHAVLREMYSHQTSSEQALNKTYDLNGLGFSAPDAPVLSPLAEKIIAGQAMTGAEEALLRSCLPKYWGQFSRLKGLLEIQPPGPRAPQSKSISRQQEAA